MTTTCCLFVRDCRHAMRAFVHFPRSARAALSIALYLLASRAGAQTFETSANLKLRAGPSSEFEILRVLEKTSRVEQLHPDSARNGYRWVVAGQDTGWVAARYLKSVAPLDVSVNRRQTALSTPGAALSGTAIAIDTSWNKQAIEHSAFSGVSSGQSFTCDPNGAAGSNDPGTNERKNRSDVPQNPHAISWDAIGRESNLPWPRQASTTRRVWTAAQLTEIEPYEGIGVIVTGFIRALRPQAGNAEDTNCGKKGEDNTDWHIALVGDPAMPESEAVVVEPTPRFKINHPGWKPTKLASFVNSGRAGDSVRVTGFLLLDPTHKGHLTRYRGTLWEVHPVTEIEVFVLGRGWITLDDFAH